MTMPGSINPAEVARAEKLYEEQILEASPNRVAARIAEVYAESLLNVAEKQGKADEIGTELDGLIYEVFDKRPEIEGFLANPAVHPRRKLEAIDKVFAGKVSPLIENFLRLLCRHGRLANIRLIAISYHALRDKQKNQVRILAESAVPLDADQIEKLKAMAAKRLNQVPIIINRVRPELLGGLLLHVGDKVFDSTVRSRLDNLRNQFLSRGSHEIQTRRDRFGSN